jgi:hypothetical protein
MTLLLALLMLTSTAFAGVQVGIVCRNGATFSIDSDLGVSAFNLKCRGKGGLAAVTDSANAGAVAADFNSTNDADIFGLANKNPVSNYDSGSSSVGSLSDTTVSLNDSNTIKDVSLGDSNTTLTKDLSGSTIKTVDSTTSLTKEASLQDAIALEKHTFNIEASLRDGSTSTLTKEGSLDSVVYEKQTLTKEGSLDPVVYEKQTLTKEGSLDSVVYEEQTLTKEGSLDSVVYEEPVLADSK